MNSLSDREKKLVFIVAGILPLVLIFVGFQYFMGQLSSKSQQLASATQRLGDMQFRADKAEMKTELKNEYKQRSLAADVSIAESEYREWLQRLAEEEINFEGPPKVTSKARVPFKSDFGDKGVLFTKLNFQLECNGTYQQIVDFLYRFYEKNYLHRIARFDFGVKKGKESTRQTAEDRDRFTLKAQIEVLSLADADKTRAPMSIENTKLFYDSKLTEQPIKELKDYYQVVLRRNLFAFPNNAPEFGSRKKEFEFEEGDRVSVRLSADDLDDDDLEYSLVSSDSKVKSDQIEESRSGSFKLDIGGIGEYEFKAKVVDKNYYPKTDEMSVVVIVKEKKEEVVEEKDPPPPPKFDPLKFTTLEAIVQDFSGESKCWIYVRPFDEMFKLGVGGEFEVGATQGKVVAINRRDAILSLDGDHYRFEVNDFLGNPQEEASVKAAETEPASDSETSDATTAVEADADSSTQGTNRPTPPEPAPPEPASSEPASSEPLIDVSRTAAGDSAKVDKPESGQAEPSEQTDAKAAKAESSDAEKSKPE